MKGISKDGVLTLQGFVLQQVVPINLSRLLLRETIFSSVKAVLTL